VTRHPAVARRTLSTYPPWVTRAGEASLDPSSPPAVGGGFLLALIPALLAALFATASAITSSIPDTRKEALRTTLTGASRAAVDRYLESPATVESRWLVLRVLGLAACAILLDRSFSASIGSLRHAVALLGVLFAYGTPAYLGMVFAKRGAEVVLPYTLRILRPFELLIAPLALPLMSFGQFVSGRVPRASRAPSASLAESEVEILVNAGEQSVAFEHEPAEMIRNVLDFGDLKAGDVMVPRTQVMAVDLATPPDELLKLVADGAHSRYPVYRERIDNIVGILHVKDLINHAALRRGLWGGSDSGPGPGVWVVRMISTLLTLRSSASRMTKSRP